MTNYSLYFRKYVRNDFPLVTSPFLVLKVYKSFFKNVFTVLYIVGPCNIKVTSVFIIFLRYYWRGLPQIGGAIIN